MDIDDRQIEGTSIEVQAGNSVGYLQQLYGHELVTKYCFDWAKRMSIEEFVKDIAPTLHTGDGADGPYSRYVIRDLSHSQIFTVTPDGVLQTHVTSVEEAKTDDWVKELMSTKADNAPLTMINSPVAVLGYSLGTVKHVVLKIPATRVFFRHIAHLDCTITLPPVAYAVTYTACGTHSIVAVIVEDNPDPKLIKYGQLSLPNVYDGGRICTGTTTLSGIAETDNLFYKTYSAWQVFTGSLWNWDLFHKHFCPDNLDEIAEEYKAEGNLVVHPGEDSDRIALKRLLTVLKDPTGYMKLKWKHIERPF